MHTQAQPYADTPEKRRLRKKLTNESKRDTKPPKVNPKLTQSYSKTIPKLIQNQPKTTQIQSRTNTKAIQY